MEAAGLKDDRYGVVVSYIDPFGAALGFLLPRDVLLAIDGHDIRSDQTVLLDKTTMEFHELLERKQWGDSVTFRVWRNGSETNVVVSLKNPTDPFAFRNLYDEEPDYFVAGGLVFSPLTRELLRTLEDELGTPNGQQLLYYSIFAKPDGLYSNREEFVVLSVRLPHPVNTYDQPFVRGILSTVNGTKIGNLEDLRKAFTHPQGGFHLLKFDGMDHVLVIDAKAAEKADTEILERYGIRSAGRTKSKSPDTE